MFLAPFPHRIRVESVSYSKDVESGSVPSWATRRDRVECLIGQVNGQGGPRFDQQVLTDSFTVATKYAGTQPGDRIYIITGPGAGGYAEIKGIAGPGPSPARLVAPTGFYLLTCERVQV